MKKLIGLIAVLAAVIAVVPVASAEDEGLGIDVTADFYSKYVWRGQLLNDDYAFQPGVSKTFSTEMGDITLGAWGSFDMTDFGGEKGRFTEIDYYVDYTVSLTDTVAASFGYIYYDFPPARTETQEFYVGLSFDTFLSPSITYYMDTDAVSGGSYLSVGIGHTFDEAFSLAEDVPVAIELGASLGYANSDYNNGYWGVDDEGFNDFVFSVALPFEIGGVSVTPSFNWTSLVDNDLRGATTEQDQFFTGISLGMSF